MSTVLITGATSGIGRACAKMFASKGFKVALTGRNEHALKEVLSMIESSGGEASGFPGDITNDRHVKNIVSSTVDCFGGVDVLINSAGVLKGGPADATSMETFDFNFDVNCRAVFSMMNECIPFLKKSSRGASIVNVSSVNGMQSFAGTMAYCASKSAVDMMTKCAAVDLAPHKIRVNSVNPGVVVTSLQKTGGLDDEAYEAFLERSRTVTHPLGRVAEADEIAEAILFLASEQSGFITGANLPIDGGRRCLGAR